MCVGSRAPRHLYPELPLDATPTAVDAFGVSLAFGGVEDVAYIRLEYEALKVTGHAHLSWLDPRKTRTVTVVGSEKMAVYDDLAAEPRESSTVAWVAPRALRPRTSGRRSIATVIRHPAYARR